MTQAEPDPKDNTVQPNQADQDPAKKKARPNVLSLTIRDKAVLYAAYMPFISNGGLFIPTNKPFDLGDEIFMLINLMDETEKISVTGQVVWLTPQGSQGSRASGIGVQFKEDEGRTIRNKIETYLVGSLQSDKPTHTM